MIYFITFASGERGIVGRMNNIYIYIYSTTCALFIYIREEMKSRCDDSPPFERKRLYAQSHWLNGALKWGGTMRFGRVTSCGVRGIQRAVTRMRV